MRCTTSRAAWAFGTSKATMSRSRILSEAAEGRHTGDLADIWPIILPGQLLTRAGTLVGGDIFRLDQVQADPFDAIAEVEHAGSAVAQVHNSVSDVGATVVDSYDNPLAVPQVGNFYEGPQREPTVGGSELKHVKILTAGRHPAVELLAVPGGIPYLVSLWRGLGYFRSCLGELSRLGLDLR